MKHKSFESDTCPVARSLDVIGDWWSLLIVRDAFAGRRRFGEFQRSLRVARNILTVRLRKLVDRGVLKLVPASDGSTYKEYVLTKKGRGLFLVLLALRQWGERSCGGGHSQWELVDRKKGRPARLELRTEDGGTVGLDEVQFTPPSEA